MPGSGIAGSCGNSMFAPFSACLLCVSLPTPHTHDLVSCRTGFSTCPVPGWQSTHTKGAQYIVMKRVSSRTLPIGPTFGKNCHGSWVQGAGATLEEVTLGLATLFLQRPLSTPEPKPLGGKGSARETRNDSFQLGHFKIQF